MLNCLKNVDLLNISSTWTYHSQMSTVWFQVWKLNDKVLLIKLY